MPAGSGWGPAWGQAWADWEAGGLTRVAGLGVGLGRLPHWMGAGLGPGLGRLPAGQLVSASSFLFLSIFLGLLLVIFSITLDLLLVIFFTPLCAIIRVDPEYAQGTGMK